MYNLHLEVIGNVFLDEKKLSKVKPIMFILYRSIARMAVLMILYRYFNFIATTSTTYIVYTNIIHIMLSIDMYL